MPGHDDHDSKTNPDPECPKCAEEVYRRTHMCHGTGKSSMAIPKGD